MRKVVRFVCMAIGLVLAVSGFASLWRARVHAQAVTFFPVLPQQGTMICLVQPSGAQQCTSPLYGVGVSSDGRTIRLFENAELTWFTDFPAADYVSAKILWTCP